MGLLVGDGTLTYKNAIILSTADREIKNAFTGVMKKQFGYTVQEKANGIDLSVSSKVIRFFFEVLGLGYKNALGKSIPVSILRAPQKIMIAFLQGLFDTDGTAEKRYGNVSLSTSSNQLAREIQAVLLSFSIISSLRSKKTKVNINYSVNISGENAIKFHTKIGFRLTRKRKRAKLASSLRMPNIGGLPHLKKTLKVIQARIVAKKDKITALKRKKSINSIFYTYLPNKRRPTREIGGTG
jgi:intein/homing endonuclease